MEKSQVSTEVHATRLVASIEIPFLCHLIATAEIADGAGTGQYVYIFYPAPVPRSPAAHSDTTRLDCHHIRFLI